MADTNRVEGSRVFCHECGNTWNREEGGLTCPRCEGEFAEILPPLTEDGPRLDGESPSSPNGGHHDHGLHDHYPWDDAERQGNSGPTTYRWSSGSPFGNGASSSFSISIRRGALPGGLDRSVETDFHDMMMNIVGNRRVGSPGRGPGIGIFNGPPPGFPGFGAPPGFGPPGSPPGSPPRRNGGGGQRGDEMPMGDVFSMLFDQHTGPQQNRGGPPPPIHPIAQLLGMLLPETTHGPHGDYVFNREDLDRVISQMMEQNPQSNAPPPATEAAINALPKKTVSKDMLDDTGKAECTICMETAELGTEVTVLPCKHWFHHDCIKPWLLSNQTCPHCRKGVQQWFEENNSGNESGSSQNRAHSEPGHSRRSSRLNARDRLSPGVGSENPEGSRSNPVLIPSSLNQMPGSFSGDDSPDGGGGDESGPYLPRRIARPYAYTPSPSHGGGSRRDLGRNLSYRSRRNSSEGGVTGWLRDHNPFSSGRG